MPLEILIVISLLLQNANGTHWQLPYHQRNVTDISKFDIPADAKIIQIYVSAISFLPAFSLDFPLCTLLGITRSKLQNIDPDAFQQLDSLEEILLADDKLNGIQHGTFWNASLVITLDLHGNQFTELVNGMFAGLIKLKTIKMHENEIISIEKKVFHDLPSLETIYLFQNNLTFIPADIFLKSPNINYINFGSNDIVYIEDIGLPESTVELLLYDNPLDCSSRLCWIVQRIANGFSD